jgi:hypothetical protein
MLQQGAYLHVYVSCLLYLICCIPGFGSGLITLHCLIRNATLVSEYVNVYVYQSPTGWHPPDSQANCIVGK